MVPTSCVEAFQLRSNLDFIASLGLKPCLDINLNILSDRELFVPEQYANSNNHLLINVSQEAASDFELDFDNGILSFVSSFASKNENLIVPIEYIDAVHSLADNVVIAMANTVTLFDKRKIKAAKLFLVR